MLQFSDLHWYKTLPSPQASTSTFLCKIGLQPEKFKDWLSNLPVQLASSDNWLAVLRMYAEHCDKSFDFRDDPIEELQCYGLTTLLAEEIMARAGQRYGEMLPMQYVVPALVFELERAVLTHESGRQQRMP